MTAAVAVGRGLSLREATASDEQFLRCVYASTRVEELAGVAWDEETRQAFLDQQFDAQAADYRRRFPSASFLVVERHGESIGRLYAADDGDAVRVLDISLLPECRGQGVGQDLLRWVLVSGRRVTLSVARGSRAQHLYIRMGFTVVADDGAYLHLERDPAS